MTDVDPDPPPVGEEVHLPGPSLIPFASAIGITLIVIGTTIWWVYSAVGGLVLLFVLYRWIRDVRRDIASLPEEHH